MGVSCAWLRPHPRLEPGADTTLLVALEEGSYARCLYGTCFSLRDFVAVWQDGVPARTLADTCTRVKWLGTTAIDGLLRQRDCEALLHVPVPPKALNLSHCCLAQLCF